MFQRLFLLLVTAGLLVLAGCEAPQTPASATPASIVGLWKSDQGDGFEVTATTFTQYSNVATKDLWFQGTIVGSSPLTSPSGYATLLITGRGSYGPAVGKYFVARWRSLIDQGVQESTPYKSGGLAEANTQADAEREFTEANGYHEGPDAWATYKRQ